MHTKYKKVPVLVQKYQKWQPWLFLAEKRFGSTAANTGSMAMSNGFNNPNDATGTSAKRVWPTLPSFAPPRDLTLGGRAPKKVFTPNLNVVRNKNLTVKTSKDTTVKRGGRGGRGGGRGGIASGGRGGKSSTLIQTKGFFSEGAGELHTRKSTGYSRYGSGGGGGDDSTSALQKPVLNKDDYKKFDIKADEQKLAELLGDSDEEDCFDYFKTETAEEDLPLRLNEAQRREKLLNLKSCKKEVLLKDDDLKDDIKKEELEDEDEDVSTLATAQKLQKLRVNSKHSKHEEMLLDAQADETSIHSALPHYPHNVTNFLDSAQTQLFLLQLPDILPCEADVDSKDFFSKKQEKRAATVESEANTSAGTRLNLKPDYDWKQMQEGQIGKILRYKSGKVCLQLGKTLFDLDVAMEPGFMQDVVSIRTNDDYERNTGHMINLGPIHAKITATPYWEECMKHYDGMQPDKL